MRNKVIHTLRKAKANFVSSVIEDARGRRCGKPTYKLLDKDAKQETNTMELEISNVLVKDPAKIANVLNDYFLDCA